MSDLDRMYQFTISDYASKVEIYNDEVAYMAIEEEQALALIEEMLSEMER